MGYAPSLTVQILPRALRRFQGEWPGVRVSLHDLSTEEMLAGLRENRLDLALMVRPAPKEARGLRFHELARYALCVAMAPGHRLARSRSLSLAKVAGEPLIGYSRSGYPEYHVAIDELFAPTGGKRSKLEEHESVSSLIAAVEAGHGLALVPSAMQCMVGPRLKIVPLTPAAPPIIVGAICRKEGVSLAAEKFIAAAADASDTRHEQ